MPRASSKRQVASATPIEIDVDWSFLRAPVNPVTAMSDFLDSLDDLGPDGGSALDGMEGLGEALKSLRVEADGGDSGARDEIAQIRAEIDTRASDDEFSFAGLMLVASLLAHAGIAVGDALPAATGRLVAEDAAQDAQDLLGIFYNDAVTSQVDEVDDWIEVAEAAITAAAVFPTDLKCRLVDLITGDAEPRRAALAIGFLLHREDEPAFAAIRGLAGRSDLGARDRRRIAAIRPWLSPARQETADAAFDRLAEPVLREIAEAEAGRKLGFIASVCDASGTSGLYATLSRARRHFGVAIMIKPSGVTEVQILKELRQQEARNFASAVMQAAPASQVDAATFARLLRQALGENLDVGAPPPVSLLQAIEILGFDGVRPEMVSAAEVLDNLLADQPDRDEPAVIAAAQVRAGTTEFADQWICNPVDIEAVAGGARTPKQLARRVQGLLPPQSSFWMRNCAVSAAVLKAGGHPVWKTLALVGRDIGRGVAPADMPLICRIAETSARAYWEVRPRPLRKRAS